MTLHFPQPLRGSLLALALAAPGLAAASSSWVPIGPPGGNVVALAAAPGGIVYAGTFWGAGVFRSLDGGRHWSLASHGLPPDSVVALAVVPGRPGLVYAAISSTVALSTDGGDHWQPAGAGLDSEGVRPAVPELAAAADGSAVYLVSSGGFLYKARPPGRSWTRLGFPHLYPTHLAVDPRRPSTLFVSVNQAIYRTTDAGESWSRLGDGVFPASKVPLVAVDPSQPGGLYALTDFPLALFHSADDGETWTTHAVPLPARNFQPSLAVLASGEVLVAPRFGDGQAPAVLASADGGATWAAADGGLDGTLDVLLAAPGERATLYAGEARGFWFSGDGGDHWHAANRGISAHLLSGLVVCPAGASSTLYSISLGFPLIAIPERPVQFRRAAGGGWQEVPGAYEVIGCDPLRPGVVYGSDTRNNLGGLWKSFDGGLSWNPLGFPQNEPILAFAIDPSSPRILYAGRAAASPSDQACQLRKSTDGGKTWACLPVRDANRLAVDPDLGSTLYLLSGHGKLLTSRDGGATWNQDGQGLPSSLLVTDFVLDPSDSRRLYAAVATFNQTGAIYSSADGARSWTLLARGLPGPVHSLVVDPRQPLTLYAGMPLAGVFRSTDGGRSFSRFEQGLPPGRFAGRLRFDPARPSILYANTSAGLYMIDTAEN
jgi:photosystem II stability/assembly factor-like uncharacterized protein